LKQEYIRQGEQALTYAWPSLPATLYLEYARTGDREKFQRPYYERRQKIIDLILAECIEGKGRFLDQIANGVWLLCEETSWVIPAHIGAQRSGVGLPDEIEPIVDLFSAETGNLLAWTHYLLDDQLGRVSRLVPGRIKAKIKERILSPCLERSDFWWMWLSHGELARHSINNWTPWICSNWLAASLVMEDDPELRFRHVNKILLVLDQFLNSYPDDGGCDEGPSYWGRAGGSLFECLELLESASGGTIDLYSNPLVKEIGRYIYRAHIEGSYYVNFSDAPAKVNIQSDLVLRYGLKIHDENLVGLGAYAAHQQRILEKGIGGSLTRQLQFLFNLRLLEKKTAREPLLKDIWLPENKFMAAREREHSSMGFYLAAQGLHNDKSHNHNDVGNFILYMEGQPLLIDVGPEAYTAKTFSSERYDIWTMQSAYHNLPTINGVMQKNGRQFAARDVQYQTWRDSVSFSLDIAGAYPPEANVSKWVRSITMNRLARTIVVREEYQLKAEAKDLSLSLMTPCQVVRSESGLLVLRVNKGDSEPPVDVSVRFEPDKLTPTIELIPLKDGGLKRMWGDGLKRILLKSRNPGQNGTFTLSYGRIAG
jgi:hypothetical protein